MVAGKTVRGHLLWMLMPAYTFGLLAFVPLVYAAVRIRRTEVTLWAVGAFVADAVIFGFAQTATSSALNSLGALLALAAAVTGTVQTLRLREEVFAKREIRPI